MWCRAILWMALLSTAASAQTSDVSWARVGQLRDGERIQVIPKKGKLLSGRFVEWSPGSIRMSLAQDVLRSVSADEVDRVLVRRKASRWKTAGIGAAVGFGVMFALGAGSASYIADENNPSAGTRMGAGAGMGVVGAGIGFGIGAAFGGSRYETVFRRAK